MAELTGRARTGISGLDEVLNGGLPRDHIYLIEGDPGVGKTTLALQFLLEGVRAGERALYVTLSETAEEVRLIAESHGWSLEGLAMFELSAIEAQMRAESENTVFHPSDIELTETTRAVLSYIDAINPQRVVFDSLSELRLLAQSHLRYRREVLNLKQHFSRTQATVVLLDDRTSDPNDMQLQSIAHGVLCLQQKPPEFGGDRRQLRIVKLRGIPYQTGYHDFEITTGGLSVYPRLIAAAHHKPFEHAVVSSGVTALDQMLGGGLERGTSTLIMGPAGTGKSVIVAQYVCAAATRGEKAAIFGFDELRSITIGRAEHLGMNMRALVDRGQVIVQQVDPAEMTPGKFSSRIDELVGQGVSLIVIDSLNGYLQSMPAERFMYIHLHELLSYMGQLGVTTVINLAQSGVIGSVQSPAEISYIADTVVLTRYFEHEGRVRKAMSVVKKRTGRHEDTIRELTIAAGRGIVVGEPLSQFSGVLGSVPQYHGEASELDAR
ncbi:MAG: ATPase domain-containing protein [Deltaproteobacteria bacterium]